MKLGIGNVDAFVHPELIQVGSVRRIEGTTAIVLGVGIVVGDASSTAIIVDAFHASGNLLRAALIAAVLIGGAFVVFREIRLGCADGSGCEEYKHGC